MPEVTEAGALFVKTARLLPAGLPLGSGADWQPEFLLYLLT